MTPSASPVAPAQGAAEDLRAAAATGEGASPLPVAAAPEKHLPGEQMPPVPSETDPLHDLMSARADAVQTNGPGGTENSHAPLGVLLPSDPQFEQAKLKAQELHRSLEDTVRANPTAAVIGAAAAGFVLSMLLRRH